MYMLVTLGGERQLVKLVALRREAGGLGQGKTKFLLAATFNPLICE